MLLFSRPSIILAVLRGEFPSIRAVITTGGLYKRETYKRKKTYRAALLACHANLYYHKRAKSHYRNRTKRAIWNMVKSDLMQRKESFNGLQIQSLRPLPPNQHL